MNKKYGNLVRPFIILCVILLTAFSLLSLFYADYVLFVIEISVTVIFALAAQIISTIRRKSFFYTMSNLLGAASEGIGESILKFPLPVSVTDYSGNIIWFNDEFFKISGTDSDDDLYGLNVEAVLSESGITVNHILDKGYIGVKLSIQNRSFTVCGYMTEQPKLRSSIPSDCNEIIILYWIEETELIELKKYIQNKNPVVGIVVIDNYDDILGAVREDGRSAVMSAVEERLINWADKQNALLKKVDRDRFYLFLENQGLEEYKIEAFSLLDTVKELKQITEKSTLKTVLTVSMGFGTGGEGFLQNEEYARQALDMALGRGGDQTAIKNAEGFTFYGGRSQPHERRTKVKARIMSTALTELIDNSDNVLIMGHRYADLDSFGASAGIVHMASTLNKQANIVMNSNGAIEDDVLEDFISGSKSGTVITSAESIELIHPKTLLVILDTHRVEYTEAPELINALALNPTCSIVVIDHHKKGTDFISPTTIFYHEPYASSCCELVTEMLSYFGAGTGVKQSKENRLSKKDAMLLLCGIVLDTKNFTFKTGVRTFEAASFLKRAGADTVAIKRIFQSDFDAFRKRVQIIAKAEFYKSSIMIAASDLPEFTGSKILMSQAADELLGISGVEAAFVLQKIGDEIHISGRSLGDINVQLIIEKLGGGGHHTIAGAQIKSIDMAQAVKLLKSSIG